MSLLAWLLRGRKPAPELEPERIDVSFAPENFQSDQSSDAWIQDAYGNLYKLTLYGDKYLFQYKLKGQGFEYHQFVVPVEEVKLWSCDMAGYMHSRWAEMPIERRLEWQLSRILMDLSIMHVYPGPDLEKYVQALLNSRYIYDSGRDSGSWGYRQYMIPMTEFIPYEELKMRIEEMGDRFREAVRARIKQDAIDALPYRTFWNYHLYLGNVDSIVLGTPGEVDSGFTIWRKGEPEFHLYPLDIASVEEINSEMQRLLEAWKRFRHRQN